MIAVVKYNAGNVHSVMCALNRIGAPSILTDDEKLIRSADKVIFPGVGEASSAMAYLREKKLDLVLSSLEQPFLGICLGMQLMTSHSTEGNTECLSIFKEDKVELFPEGRGYKIPQVGWNTVEPIDDELFYGIDKESYVYFVHSFYVPRSAYSASLTEYDGLLYSSSLRKDNYFGVQFHPEKSGKVGERILRNFVEVVK